MTQQLTRTEPVQQIAKRAVNECLRVQEDEQITINAWSHTLEYASALALEVEKAGGVSTMVLETDEFFWGYLSSDIPEKQYTRRQKTTLSMLEATDATIGLGGPRDPSGFSKVPGDRLNTMFEGDREIGDRFRELKIRSLGIPIGLITPERAKTYGFDYNNWRSSFSSALNVDHEKMSALGKKIASRLTNSKHVKVTSPTGTNLSFSLANRPVHVRDGILDTEDIADGTLEESLPSGSVELAPQEDSAHGTVVFDQPTALRGKMIQGMQWQFENGKLASAKAAANFDVFKDLYDTASGDKDKIASFAIGLNPAAQLIGFFTDNIVLGAATIGIGSNKSIGGVNETQFGHAQQIRKPTIEVDGYKIVVDGAIHA